MPNCAFSYYPHLKNAQVVQQYTIPGAGPAPQQMTPGVPQAQHPYGQQVMPPAGGPQMPQVAVAQQAPGMVPAQNLYGAQQVPMMGTQSAGAVPYADPRYAQAGGQYMQPQPPPQR